MLFKAYWKLLHKKWNLSEKNNDCRKKKEASDFKTNEIEKISKLCNASHKLKNDCTAEPNLNCLQLHVRTAFSGIICNFGRMNYCIRTMTCHLYFTCNLQMVFSFFTHLRRDVEAAYIVNIWTSLTI